MIKTSRRAIFRSVFGRVGFELQLDTANEVLMRLNRSLDPIPVTEGMWAAYLINRRPLRYIDFARPSAGGHTDIASEVDAAVAHASFDQVPAETARDLLFLLRAESLLRMWTATSATESGAVSTEERRRQILAGLEHEIWRYLSYEAASDPFPRELVDRVVTYLVKDTGVDRSQP